VCGSRRWGRGGAVNRLVLLLFLLSSKMARSVLGFSSYYTEARSSPPQSQRGFSITVRSPSYSYTLIDMGQGCSYPYHHDQLIADGVTPEYLLRSPRNNQKVAHGPDDGSSRTSSLWIVQPLSHTVTLRPQPTAAPFQPSDLAVRSLTFSSTSNHAVARVTVLDHD
jgi:hypothetical protein